MDRLARAIRRVWLGSEMRLARAWQAQSAADRDRLSQVDRDLFLERFRCQPGQEILLGRMREQDGTPTWCGLTATEFLRHHSWITGATGSGKSYFTAGCLLQMIRRGHAVTVVDLKSELTEILTGVILPALAADPTTGNLVDRVRIVRPFGDPLPALRVTEPEPGVPRGIQAHNLAAALADAIGGDLGPRMERVFLRMAALALERRLPLTILQEWLQSPMAFLRDARSSEDPALRAYAAAGFERESRPAIDALASRLDSFLFLDEVRLSLSAPSCVNFSSGLERGTVTIVDLGSPPAGAERVQRFWSGILLGRIARAVLSRPITDNSPPAWLVIEEAQEALSKDSAEQLARLLALARHKRVALTLINQQPAQLSAVDPMLVRILRTNAGFEFAFRCNYEDARSLVEPMPLPPGTARSGEVRQMLAQDLTRLPTREYLLWAKQEAFGAQRLRSPRLDIPSLKREGQSLDSEIRRKIGHGTVSIPRAELERIVRADQTSSPVGPGILEQLVAETNPNRSRLG